MTMCTSVECPMRKECSRADSGSGNCQDYFNYEYSCNENSGFDDFCKNISAKNIQEMKKYCFPLVNQ